MSATTTAFVHVDITAPRVALVSGPGFRGRVLAGYGPRSSVTNRPTYVVTLTDVTAESVVDVAGREPMSATTRALHKGFVAATCDMARMLAAHYGVTDIVITVDDLTHNYAITED